ncbi:hypothetical protein PPERSA_00416 [Pseudocohnilembus persalinus]|uniref:WASH complex subunit strumpellin n=1 Tax=Pseudocohnilembus persalinus TaxID=266149 RepID=A0A0V0QYC4_PSEPJ|nr:hypothetical protein PPERSA_00416 [Pseudocohnilembus persalinus]|eukprot:KRX07259.1 hypothetical protein PPERSA_00416 [Pseudocohnilembus persalinus]
MADLLDKENACGQSLLKLTSRGSAILAELQRLSSNIPKVFYEIQQQEGQQTGYGKILFDFEYLKNIDGYEDSIQTNMELVELDNSFRDTYIDLLERFYQLFESIYVYYLDITELLEQIFEGEFIQYTFDSLIQNEEGKKIVPELFYQYGVMLLLTDKLIPGPIRERIITSYIRYKNSVQEISNINDVCKLFKATGYLPASYTKSYEYRPQYYPEDYFSRFGFDESIMESIIDQVKDGDIYSSCAAYPSPQHRSVALSQQGSILYILLFFHPDILIEKKAKMREIVDKHFSDNWVITFYIGYYVDLTTDWKPYKAAKKAIDNTLDLDYIEELSQFHLKQLEDCYNKCQNFLIDGVLTEEYVLEKWKLLINTIRESNITVRWLMLHVNSDMKAVRDVVTNGLKKKDILSLLLITSKFESKLTEKLELLINQKNERWDKDKNECAFRMDQLADIFGGKMNLGKVEKNEGIQQWFEQLRDQIKNLTFGDITYTGGKINQFIKALEDMEQYLPVDIDHYIKHYLEDTRKDLRHMNKISSNITPNQLTHLSLICDLSYSWKCLPDYVELMQDKIKKYPQVALLLKSTFIKLSCILNTPMVRIVQAQSPDLQSVSKYYSQELINFVKSVLQIIPQQVFAILEDVIILLTEKMAKIPTKLNKNDLKNYTQYQERYDLANHSYRISLLTESILSMEKYLIGVIEINPKDILDEGIQKELIKLIQKILNRVLVFKKGTIQEFQEKLQILAKNLEGFKEAVVYIQDFISTYGVKIFHQQFDRLITNYIDMEQEAFIQNTFDIDFMFYEEDIPLPNVEKNKQYGSVNFMGRLLKQILNLTNGKNAVFIEQSLGFYEIGTGVEIITLKTMGLLYKCIGISGLSGLDQFLGFNISTTMRDIMKIYRKKVTKDGERYLRDSFQKLSDLTNSGAGFEKTIAELQKNFGGLIQSLVKPLQQIGHMILIRKLLCLQLQLMSKVGSKRLYLCLENLNNGIINDVTNRVYDQEMTEEDIQKENLLISEAAKLCSYIGMTDPEKKVYISDEHMEALPMLMFLVTTSTIPNMDLDKKINILIRRGQYNKPDQKKQSAANSNFQGFQPVYFMHGVLGFLNQFHPDNKDVYMGFLANQIKCLLNVNQMLLVQSNQEKDKKSQYQENVANIFLYITLFDSLLNVSGDSRNQQINAMVPIELINTCFSH